MPWTLAKQRKEVRNSGQVMSRSHWHQTKQDKVLFMIEYVLHKKPSKSRSKPAQVLLKQKLCSLRSLAKQSRVAPCCGCKPVNRKNCGTRDARKPNETQGRSIVQFAFIYSAKGIKNIFQAQCWVTRCSPCLLRTDKIQRKV